MASWERFTEEAPALAERVQARLAASRHQVLGTLRSDGSPRLSGIEVFFHASDLWFGSMLGSGKSRDLIADGRFALHTAPLEEDLANGDATLDGAVEQVEDLDLWKAITAHLDGPEPDELTGDLFRADLQRVRLVRVDGNEMVIETWRPGSSPRVSRRA